MSGGAFHVRLNVAPHPEDKRRSIRQFGVVCNVCLGANETYTAFTAEEHDIKHEEATMAAAVRETCELCGNHVPVPLVAESALSAAL